MAMDLRFGVNAGVKSQGPDQMYQICLKLPDSSGPGLLCLPTRIEIPELLKHLRLTPLTRYNLVLPILMLIFWIFGLLVAF
jgi:hypothetical protein